MDPSFDVPYVDRFICDPLFADGSLHMSRIWFLLVPNFQHGKGSFILLIYSVEMYAVAYVTLCHLNHLPYIIVHSYV